MRSVGGGVPTKARGRRRMLRALHWADQPSVISLVEIIIPLFQINHSKRTKHAAARLPASVTERCTPHRGCLAPSEECVNCYSQKIGKLE